MAAAITATHSLTVPPASRTPAVIAAAMTYPLALWATRALAHEDLKLLLSVLR